LGHVLSDMDRTVPCEVKAGWYRFNWATSFQTWIDGTYEQRFTLEREFQLGHVLSDMDSVTTFIIPSGSAKFQLGHVLSDMDRRRTRRHNAEAQWRFQLGHVLSDMDRAAILRPSLLSK